MSLISPWRADFPGILALEAEGQTYLDSAATAQKPQAVLDAIGVERLALVGLSMVVKTLLEQGALAEKKNISVVIGGPYNSGILAGGTHYEYQQATPEILARVDALRAVCAEFNVDIRAAALQFSLAHPAVAAVIPGASQPSRIAENLALVDAEIPAAFWQALRTRGLVAVDAPLPQAG